MTPFIGRQKELDHLTRAHASAGTEFIPVYGRRRVGKSELILHFIRGKNAIYCLGKKGPAALQISGFLKESSAHFNEPLLAQVQVGGWKEALETVVARKRTAKKLVLVLDEFQWIVEASPELPSILQEFLDRDWKRRGDILLIVCGSYMGFMEKEVLGEKSPLFGRRSAQIFLKPFSYVEAARFHPHWSRSDQAKVYFVCGGIPYYLNFFSEKFSLPVNIQNNFFDEYSALFREPEFLLREELRELQKYYGLLMAIASGFHTGKDMAAKTGIDERKLYYYLQHLIGLGYVRRAFPLTTKKPAPQEVKFILADPLLRFWFRFVYPHMGSIAQMKPGEVFANHVKPQLESYFGACFEHLCREALARFYQKQGVTTPFEIGEYWDRQVQIDVVGYRQNEGIDIGECRWGRIKSVNRLLDELERKVKLYPNPHGLTIQRHVFSQSPLKAPAGKPAVSFVSLDDLYKYKQE